MSNLPNTFAEKTEPLNKGLSKICDEAIENLESKGYEVRLGLTTEYADQITVMAQEPAILENCPKDAATRFTDRAATEAWLARLRGVFLLLKKTDDGEPKLAGYGWISAEPSEHVPAGESSWAIRVGQDHQGQGLSTPFSTLIVYGSAKVYGVSNIWLSTWESNGAAIHVYHKLGFKDVFSEPVHREHLDGEGFDDTRQYMLLPNELL